MSPEAERGAEALRPWLHHDDACPRWLTQPGITEPCICGLDAAWDAALASVSAPRGLTEQKLRDALVRAEAAIARRDAEIDRLSALPDPAPRGLTEDERRVVERPIEDQPPTEAVGDGSGHPLPPFDPTVERMDEL